MLGAYSIRQLKELVSIINLLPEYTMVADLKDYLETEVSRKISELQVSDPGIIETKKCKFDGTLMTLYAEGDSDLHYYCTSCGYGEFVEGITASTVR